MAWWRRRRGRGKGCHVRGHHGTEICASVGDELLKEAPTTHGHERIQFFAKEKGK